MKKKSLNLKSNLFLGKEVITPLGQNASTVYGGDDSVTCGSLRCPQPTGSIPGGPNNTCITMEAPSIRICPPTPPTGYLVETNCCGTGGNSQNACDSFKCGVSQ